MKQQANSLKPHAKTIWRRLNAKVGSCKTLSGVTGIMYSHLSYIRPARYC